MRSKSHYLNYGELPFISFGFASLFGKSFFSTLLPFTLCRIQTADYCCLYKKKFIQFYFAEYYEFFFLQNGLKFWHTIVIRAVKDIQKRSLSKICDCVKMFRLDQFSKKNCFFHEASIVVICVVRMKASYKPTIFNFTHTKFSRLIFHCTSHTTIGSPVSMNAMNFDVC